MQQYVMTLQSTSSPRVLFQLSMMTEYRLGGFGGAAPAAVFGVVRLVRARLEMTGDRAVAAVGAVFPLLGLRWRGRCGEWLRMARIGERRNARAAVYT